MRRALRVRDLHKLGAEDGVRQKNLSLRETHPVCIRCVLLVRKRVSVHTCRVEKWGVPWACVSFTNSAQKKASDGNTVVVYLIHTTCTLKVAKGSRYGVAYRPVGWRSGACPGRV